MKWRSVSAFTVSLQKDVSLAGPATLDINSMGKPSAAGTYVLTANSTSLNVSVAAALLLYEARRQRSG